MVRWRLRNPFSNLDFTKLKCFEKKFWSIWSIFLVEWDILSEVEPTVEPLKSIFVVMLEANAQIISLALLFLQTLHSWALPHHSLKGRWWKCDLIITELWVLVQNARWSKSRIFYSFENLSFILLFLNQEFCLSRRLKMIEMDGWTTAFKIRLV